MNLKNFLVLNLLAALWGGSFLFMRLAASALSPVLLIELRVLIAGLALLFYAILIGKAPVFKGKRLHYLVLGTINAGLPFTLIAASEVHLTASVSSILNATTPLFTILVARFWIKERISIKKMAGVFLGIAGVAVLVGGFHSNGQASLLLLSAAFSLLAAISYGFGSVYTKVKFTDEQPLALTIGQQLGAALILIPFALPQTGHMKQLSDPLLLASVVALAILCTSVAYIFFFYLIHSVGPTRTTSVTLLVSVYGVLWGAIFLHEKLSLSTLAGMLVILSSMVLINGWKLPLLGRLFSKHASYR
ncbi:MAG: DMT family transporter [Sporolactobacillus sp.]